MYEHMTTREFNEFMLTQIEDYEPVCVGQEEVPERLLNEDA